MCKIGKFLKKELVACHAGIKTKEELFEYIADLFVYQVFRVPSATGWPTP